MKKSNTSLEKLGRALDRLEEILKEPLDKHDFVLDAAVQRFEFVIELYWKTLKHLLSEQGVETSLPKESLQKAFAAGWIQDEKIWLEMLKDRNLTSHTYEHQAAMRIYTNLQRYYPQMREVYEKLKELPSDLAQV